MLARGDASLKTSIPNHQFIAMVALISLGAFIPVCSTSQSLEHFVPFLYIIVAIAGVFMTLFYGFLGGLFAGKNIVEINKQAFGKIFGTVLNFLLFCYMLFIAVYYFLSMVYYWAMLDMPNSPVLLYASLVSLLCYFAGSLGIKVITKSSMIILLNFFIALIGYCVLLVPKWQIKRILPVFEFDSSVAMNSFALFFSLIFVMMYFAFTFADKVDFTEKKNKYSFLTAGIIASLIFIIRGFSDVMILGEAIKLYLYPSMQTLRQIEISGTFARVELFGVLGIISLALMFLIIIYYAISQIGSSVFKLKGHKTILSIALLISVAVVCGIYEVNILDIQSFFGKAIVGCSAFWLVIMLLTVIRGLSIKKRTLLIKAEAGNTGQHVESLTCKQTVSD